MTELRFDALPLHADIQKAIIAKGYTTPSPIQAKAIPVLLEGRDLLACAQTGTGKTAAFALPILNRIANNPRPTFRKGVRFLVLAPTRELAIQVSDSFHTYGKYLNFRIGTVYGGVSQNPQTKALHQGLDVLVATTGRLLDLYQQGFVDLSSVECFILDEADRMLDMGFINDIRKISAQIPKNRQTLLFSATMAPDITKLAQDLLNNPEEIRIAPQGSTADKIDQSILYVHKNNKPKLLLELIQRHIQDNPKELSLVFSRTKHGAKKLARMLEQTGIDADSIHGNKSQAARVKTLDRYKSGKTPVLVATDVAARGIDVKNITLVINFDLPMESDAYVHRIGRTARAGTSGRALSFCSIEEVGLLRQIEKLIKREIPIIDDHSQHSDDIQDQHLRGNPRDDIKIVQGGGGNRGGGQGGGGRGGNRPGGNRGGKGGGRPNANRANGGRGRPSGDNSGAKSSGATRSRGRNR
jgi:ATP-dependent RNA helicase RhlE